MIKFVVLSLVVVAFVYGADIPKEVEEKLNKHHKECSVTSGISEDVIKEMREGVFTEDPKLKEHLFCVSKKIGFQNDAGDVQMDVLKAKLNLVIQNEASTEDYIKKCLIKKEKPEDSAYETVKCYYQSVLTF